jgi:uncharacterized protein
MGYPVIHFEVVGSDGDRTKKFYGDLFEWEINSDNPMDYGIVDRDKNTGAGDDQGISGGLFGSPEGGNHLTFYVAVPDVEAAMQRAEELGGKRVMGPDQVPGMELVIGHIEDPDGNLVGVLNGGEG